MLRIPKVIKTDNGLTYASKAFDEFLQQWGVEHKKGIPFFPMGQAVTERTLQSLKRVLEQEGGDSAVLVPQLQLCKALFHVSFLKCSLENLNPPVVRHFSQNVSLRLRERSPVTVKNPETWDVKGPYELVTWGRAYVYVSSPSGLKWVSQKWVKPYLPKTSKGPVNQPKDVTVASLF